MRANDSRVCRTVSFKPSTESGGWSNAVAVRLLKSATCSSRSSTRWIFDASSITPCRCISSATSRKYVCEP